MGIVKVCHKHHFKIGPKRSFSEVELEDNASWAVYHLAQKYTEGCVPEFIKQLVLTQLNTTFKTELEEDLETFKKARNEEQTKRSSVDTDSQSQATSA